MKRRLEDADMGAERERKFSATSGSHLSLAAAAMSDDLKQMVASMIAKEFLQSMMASTTQSTNRFGNVRFEPEEQTNVNAFLHQKLGKDNLTRRPGPGGTRLTYIESCKAIELANKAFGFNGWSCRVLECKEEYRLQKNDRWSIGFSSLVRIELKDGTTHEDFGFGQADGQRDLGATIEQAKKHASMPV
uniref:Rad52/22 double-strand break repair protein n=1 Tax=Globisporangium ultimum (strain ATCC 200006 / CBS 805.95 / DAOM BR144) TaxID=431595 RepID=K3X8P0_GLOUD